MVRAERCGWKLVWVWGFYGLCMAWLAGRMHEAGFADGAAWGVAAVIAVAVLVWMREV
jgi:hypothetical protein